MTVTRNKTVSEVVVFALEDVPKEYVSYIDDAIATIVNGEVDEVTIHIGTHTYAICVDCIEWLQTLISLASGLLEELEKDFASSL